MVKARSRWGPGQGFSLPFPAVRVMLVGGTAVPEGKTMVLDALVEWRGGYFGEEGHGGGKGGRESALGRAELEPPGAIEPLGTRF